MTDSLKLAEMQRTSIEFERQRHLANWFIKSSPHMATPPSASYNPNGCENSISNRAQKSSAAGQAGTTNNNFEAVGSGGAGGAGTTTTTSSGNGTKNGTITTSNPIFYLMNQPPPHQGKHPVGTAAVNGGGGAGNGGGGGGSSNLLMSRSQIFTSQTNLPLQIVTTGSGQDGRKPKLRRFNSHDTSANMFSVADFENARLARRNEIEMKQRLQQRLKMNSLSSGGGDCSTGDSKGSKYSNESQTDPLQADLFLDRYSLPRVVRISYKSKFCNETLQSSSSNGSASTQSSTASSSSNSNNNNNVNDSKANSSARQNGELFLLYRHLKQRKIYHGFNTKTGIANRKKGVMIPQEFPGYFSLLNDKGAPTATMYTTIIQLVRERVYKFISVGNITAFTESANTDGFPSRPQYIKSNARSGQVFRLLAVFEDGKQEAKLGNISSGREKDKGRYAQLLNENRQILYVSLSTKGKFYEIEPTVPQILQKTGSKEHPKKANADCVHKISAIMAGARELPVHLRFISGPLGCSGSVPENLTVTRVSTEDVVISCPIEDVEAQSPLHLRKLHVTPEMAFLKCFLGFESEQRMLANQNVQNMLKFCQFNCDQFLKMVEAEVLSRPERSASKSRVDGLKILKPLSLLRREKSTVAHEKEDSIIFLSKNDLASMEEQPQPPQNRITDKMKVFQATKKKWFRRGDKHTSLTSLDIGVHSKRMSMERYNDMSKLLQERFGDGVSETIAERPTSDLGCADSAKGAAHIQKSLSLQEVDFLDKPDLVPSLSLFNESMSTLEDKENKGNQQSFISPKLFSEFHVKTRQYSKSSTSLHQLLHFSVPKKMNVVETKKKQPVPAPRRLEFNIGDVVSSAGGTIVDDLPYSSVRDSLLISSGDFVTLTDTSEAMSYSFSAADYAKENIYAEICADSVQPAPTTNTTNSLQGEVVSAMGGTVAGAAISRIQINGDELAVSLTGGASNDNIYNTLK